MAEGRQRIDKWLWHARVARTRTLSQKLAESGHVRVNGERVAAASYAVRAGDVLTIALEERVRILAVTGFSERRGSATAASALFEERSPPRPERPAPALPSGRDAGSGRPTKRDRRAIDRLEGRD
jgi:ribosome-associated heat shock protein Hsp15